MPAETPGEVWLHHFPGSNDNDRLRAAISHITQQTRRPALRFWHPSGTSDIITISIDEYPGLRFKGPVDSVGMQNIEQGPANVPYVLRLAVGTGANVFIRGTRTTYGMNVSDLCVEGVGGNSQFWDHPYSAGTAFSVSMGNMQFVNMRHVLGRPGEHLAATLWSFWGMWNVLGLLDEPFLLRGSDCFLTPTKLNIGWAGAPAGKYLLRLGSVGKSKVSNWYMTCRGGGSRAMLVQGFPGIEGDLRISDCVIEGESSGDPASSALVRCQDSAVASFRDCALNFAMGNPGVNGNQDRAYFEVTGNSKVWVDGFDVNRANGVGEEVPVARVSGGATLDVQRMRGLGWWGNKPLVLNEGGTLTNDASVRTT